MKCMVDSRGRVVIPTKLLREVGLNPGATVDVRFRDGRIEIKPATLSVRLVRKGQLLVAIPTKPTATLTSQTTEETREALRHKVRG